MPELGFSSKVLSFAALTAIGLTFAGCEASVSTGGDKTDTDSVESSIKAQYPDKSGGFKLTSITCEEGDAKVDATFTCSAVNDVGTKLEIEGTVTSVKDGDVGFSWSTTKTLAKGIAFSDAAATNLQNQGSAVSSIECPEEIEIKKGNQVDCTATMDNGTTQDVKLTLTDNNGGFDADLSGPTS